MNNGKADHNVVLSARGLSKTYGQHQALADLSFELRAGEIVGLLGPNGAGKTTAIRVLTTIFPATRGYFSVLGIPDSRPKEIRALIGVLPESNGYPSSMTGEQFLIYMGRLYGQTTTQAKEKAAQLLRISGLETAGRSRIFTYSQGMRRRLGIARALINSPRILFLDEPTLGIDPIGHRELLQIIRRAAEVDQAAIVLSSHLLGVVEQMCSRVLILKRGHVVVEGPVSEIKRQVSVAHTCRIQVAVENTQKALSTLTKLAGIEAKSNPDRRDEIVVSSQGQEKEDAMNEILQQLIQARVPIESFTRDSTSLNDAFLSMIEEDKV